jgi:hypothetical protein
MKNKLIRILFVCLFLPLLMAESCSDEFADMNVNPNEPVTVNVDYLFLYSVRQGICSYNSDVNLKQWGLMTWMMYFAPRGGVEPGKEYVVPTGKDAFWQEQYADALANINEVIELTSTDQEMVNKNAAARIWRVWLFHRITDLWGEIPYSEALQGMSNLNYSPVYDAQESIYLDMINELEQAEESISDSKPFFSAAYDVIGKGDANSWRIFANSLRLRLATRIRFRLPSVYADQVLDLSGKVSMTSNSASVLFPFNSEKKNPVYEAVFTGQSIVQSNPSKFFVDMLLNTNDPRISIFLDKAPMSVLPWIEPYNGIPNLMLTTDPAWSNYNLDGNWGDISTIGSWFLRNNTPGVIISYPEVCFLKSEAALLSLWPGSAQQYYEDGIEAAINFYHVDGDTTWDVSQTEIDNYISSAPPVSLEEIITQKWILFAFENGYEAYAEYRRTGFPQLKAYDGSPADAGLIPKRMIYPNFEMTLNSEHYFEAIGRQGPDNELTPIWWDNN